MLYPIELRAQRPPSVGGAVLRQLPGIANPLAEPTNRWVRCDQAALDVFPKRHDGRR